MTKLKCNKCGDILEGDKRGTYIECSCGKCAIDETEYYYRIIGNEEDWEIIEEDEKNDIREDKSKKNEQDKET